MTDPLFAEATVKKLFMEGRVLTDISAPPLDLGDSSFKAEHFKACLRKALRYVVARYDRAFYDLGKVAFPYPGRSCYCRLFTMRPELIELINFHSDEF